MSKAKYYFQEVLYSYFHTIYTSHNNVYGAHDNIRKDDEIKVFVYHKNLTSGISRQKLLLLFTEVGQDSYP